jgi:ABC-type transport system involved in multi-copper enzyme maturation permease subunit
MTATNRRRPRPSWFTRFWAVVRYEMLWNIRKKKFIAIVIAAFGLVTLNIVVPTFLNLGENPDFAATFSVGSLVFFLIALGTVMNSISGEFESGTIVPLLTKPVSRTMVFLAKLFTAFIIIMVTYTVLFTYSTIVGILMYGPQANLQLVPLALIGNVISTFVWVAIILAMGSISKSSLFAALGGLVLFIAFVFAASLIPSFSNATGAIDYIPGAGSSGTLNVAQRSQNITIQNVTISTNQLSTGTDSIGSNLANYALHPSATANITRTDVFSMPPKVIQLYTESLGTIVLRSIGIAFAYILVFMFVAWLAFKRAQILE